MLQRLDRVGPIDPESKFLENVSRVLQRQSSGSRTAQELQAQYVVSSYEVEIFFEETLGHGSFGQVFRGKFTGAVSATTILCTLWAS